VFKTPFGYIPSLENIVLFGSKRVTMCLHKKRAEVTNFSTWVVKASFSPLAEHDCNVVDPNTGCLFPVVSIHNTPAQCIKSAVIMSHARHCAHGWDFLVQRLHRHDMFARHRDRDRALRRLRH
jgi:hypothetical protein